MSGKKMLGIGLMLILLSGIGIDGSYAQQSKSGQAYVVDPELCALMLRKGKESFSRARYNEARDYFRKAVQADPNSQKAWSYYDLAQMYSVAEQFKNHGRIVQSTAPAPEQTAELTPPQPAPPTSVQAAPALKPTKVKEKIPPAKKEKPGTKEIPQAATEQKKVEPVPTTPAPAKPTPAPTPTPAPGGIKIQKDEGC